MKLNKEKFKKIHGYYEGKVDAIDPDAWAIAENYKKNFLKKFISINQKQIDSRLGGDTYYVTRKYDGEYAIIFFDGNQAFTVNRSGRTRFGIPCIDEAAEILKKKGIRQAIIPAEIYLYDGERRTRTDDLLHALARVNMIHNLKLAVFDILELDNKKYKPANYSETIDELRYIFGNGEKVHSVDMEIAGSGDRVKAIYHKWVEEEGSEGLVVRSELPFVYKIKPRHNIDVVVIGFTEGTGDQKGMVRTTLVALIPEEGKYQVIGKVGGGMTDKLKKELFRKFSDMIIESEFIETDSNFVAFHMIEPGTIMEIEINDIIYETASGKLQSPVLEIEDGKYKIIEITDGFSFIAPVFRRIREDKQADASDVRISQVESFLQRDADEITFRKIDRKTKKSKLLFREVFRKELGSKLMVQKYLVWQTNKESTGEFPAYVFFYTNFSSDRKEPLQTDVTISDDKKQIMELMEKAKEQNIKQGWKVVE